MITKASNLELHLNLTTYHFFESCEVSSRFSNKAYDCGRGIINPIIGLQDNDTGYRSLLGLNSIGELMIGASKTYSSGIVLGGYLQDGSRYLDRGISSFKLFSMNSLDIVPIIGYNMNLYKQKNFGVSFTVTPILSLIYLTFPIK